MKRTLVIVALCGTLFGGSAFIGSACADVGSLSSADCTVVSFKEVKQQDGSYKQIEVRQCPDGAVGVCSRVRRGAEVTPWSCIEL